MSELEQVTQIINTILSNDNDARKRSEALLKDLREKNINGYILAFASLLKGKLLLMHILIFCSLLRKCSQGFLPCSS